MEAVGLKDKRNILKKYIYPAIEQHLIEQLYPESPNHPQQKYRLTDKGKESLKQEQTDGEKEEQSIAGNL